MARASFTVGVLIACGCLSATVLASCGGQDSSGQALIDEFDGTYRGVGLEDTGTRVVEVFGKSPPLRSKPVTPTGRNVTELNFAPRARCDLPHKGRSAVFRYELVAFRLETPFVCEVNVIDERAATTRGISIGDPLSEVEEAYPTLHCGEFIRGENLRVPFCSGRLAKDRFIWFGDDPIDSIEMNTLPLRD